ncbi:hypothetical protein LUZ61_006132 [Rhynchospora tenuis]|uniref:BTB domain-containing protein n=1 Tax=Rhynchospora tenuis TaxID=198213 RepID=A0AAD5ZR23_9POAL|nr:hypothetical protein LUZ61_006132 [Rhynchospora tenuis]
MKGLKVDQFVSSPLFHALGHDWLIDCYRHEDGWDGWDGWDDSASFLIRLQGEYKDVNPTFRCSVMTRDGKMISLKRILKGDGAIFESAVEKSPFQRQVFAYFNIECALLKDGITHDGNYELICSIDDIDNRPNRFSLGVSKSFNLQSQIGNLFESSETADVTFDVENHSFRCHRLILAARSSVLKAELFGNMVEATQKHIKIEDICPEVFKVMLHFMYTDTLPHCDFETASAEMVQHLFVAADRYAIEGLKSLCEEKLCDSISLDTFCSTLALAEQHNSPRLKNSCVEFIAVPDTLMSWMLTEDYIDLMQNFPSIIAELRSKVNNISSSRDLKKRKK